MKLKWMVGWGAPGAGVSAAVMTERGGAACA